jgi:tRNA uridine 5-carboxymethylaminomethyl modification enzyme
MCIPDALQYVGLTFLSMEAREKLNKLHPRTVGQASRIAGISPADIANLVIHLRKHTAG